MVKKLKSLSEKKSAAAGGLLDSQIASAVKDSAQQIWLAGMGAFAVRCSKIDSSLSQF